MDKVNSGGFYSFRERGDGYGSFALELVSGSKCQLRCRNCYKRKTASGLKNSDMSDDFVFNAIRQAKECGFAEIVFIGGEPTLHSSLPGFMEFALETGLTPIVATNGIKLSDYSYAEKVALKGGQLWCCTLPCLKKRRTDTLAITVIASYCSRHMIMCWTEKG